MKKVALRLALVEQREQPLDVAFDAALHRVPPVPFDMRCERRDLELVLDVDGQRVDDFAGVAHRMRQGSLGTVRSRRVGRGCRVAQRRPRGDSALQAVSQFLRRHGMRDEDLRRRFGGSCRGGSSSECALRLHERAHQVEKPLTLSRAGRRDRPCSAAAARCRPGPGALSVGAVSGSRNGVATACGPISPVISAATALTSAAVKWSVREKAREHHAVAHRC